ncbi:MAG: exonuclease domain-containing protein [Lachnospiraceae bacterium]|nr:exonuclease domain-containing protein [Lachnospiraceae bacterium]MCI9282865.1 exonuclease domain-containing protein [Lachnospiraceae bacterium]
MRNYIIFDLEWNQSAHGKADSIEDFPFEIIEIGAVRLGQDYSMTEEFHRLIRPQVYTQMHYAISEVTHMDMTELRFHGEDFKVAARDFLNWCKEDCIYCTWGSMDLTELQRNMKYFMIENPFPKPLFYYDVQKLYALFYKNGIKPSLDSAVEELGLLEDRPFHRALDDAYYTGKVFRRMMEELGEELLLAYWSIDYYRIPDNKSEEIRVVFPDYSKYVSRMFPSKEDAMKERSVAEMKCYKCGRMLRKKVRWFTPNQKIYYGLALCPEHGYLKGKVRMKRIDDSQVYVVKTLKLIDEDSARKVMDRKEDIRKKRMQRNREKRRRLKDLQKKSG